MDTSKHFTVHCCSVAPGASGGVGAGSVAFCFSLGDTLSCSWAYVVYDVNETCGTFNGAEDMHYALPFVVTCALQKRKRVATSIAHVVAGFRISKRALTAHSHLSCLAYLFGDSTASLPSMLLAFHRARY